MFFFHSVCCDIVSRAPLLCVHTAKKKTEVPAEIKYISLNIVGVETKVNREDRLVVVHKVRCAHAVYILICVCPDLEMGDDLADVVHCSIEPLDVKMPPFDES